MSTAHISGEKGQVAESILLPGDPLRAKFIAETYLEDVEQFNAVRNMFGYTGRYKGKEVSVMGTGMGIPSMGIYSHELIHEYGVKNLIRVGSCGSYQKDLKLNDIVIAMGACSNSNFAQQYNLPGTYSAIASWELLAKAVKIAEEKNYDVNVGNIFSSDIFYNDTPDLYEKWVKMGVMAVEMEAYGLYCTAAAAGVNALAIMTVSDSLVENLAMSVEDREKSFKKMMEIALELA